MRSIVFFAVLALALVGCDDANNVSFYIAGHATAGAGGEGAESCTVDAEDPTLGARGVLDVGEFCAATPGGPFTFPRQYVLFPLYVNQIINRESQGPLRADPNGIFVQGAEIELRDTSGAALATGGLPNPFTVTASNFVPSASGVTEARAVGSLEIIPPLYGEQLALAGGNFTIVAAVTAFGETNGDVAVETGEFLWPIDVCRGCLVQEIIPSADGTGGTAFSCLPGQDSPSVIDCNSL